MTGQNLLRLAASCFTVSTLRAAPADQPQRPASGPGSAVYQHGSVKKTGPLGQGSEAYWLYEPAEPAPAHAPVIVFLHGYLGVDARFYGGWIEHLVRRGHTVIYPLYQTTPFQPETYTANALTAVKDGFQTLETPGHVHPDPAGRWAIAAHSMGCPIGANLAWMASGKDLPPPKAVFFCNAGNANSLVRWVPSILVDPEKIPDLWMAVVVGNQDHFVGTTTGREIFERSTGVSPAHKTFITINSDRNLRANHFAPLSTDDRYTNGATLSFAPENSRDTPGAGPNPWRRGFRQDKSNFPDAGKTDALDYYGYWSWFDALTEAAFASGNAKFAPADPAGQIFMGRWKDGSPVKPAVVGLP